MQSDKPANIKIDSWSWWKCAVSRLNVQPKEAWNLNLKEIKYLMDITPPQDNAVMLFHQRLSNGAGRDWLMGKQRQWQANN